jgi:hypothetical protein
MTRNIREHMEVEIALLAGVFGFFLGGLINFRKEIVDIVLSAVVTGVLVFVTAYYAMKLVFSGVKKSSNESEGMFAEDNFVRVKADKAAAINAGKPAEGSLKKSVKGKRLDIVSSDDSLFEDLYKK